jgi:acetyl esterase/lipase
MHIRFRIAILVAIGLIAASCSAAEGTDGVAEVATDTSSSPTTEAPIDGPHGTDAKDVVIRMRTDVLTPGSTDLLPQAATLRIPPNLNGSGPVVVLLHGAGRSLHSLESMADAAAALGVPVLNASWLASPVHPREAGADAVCAVAYAYENAASWGADPERVIAMGHSGGGHVGMLAALAPEAFPECPTASDSKVWAYLGLAGDPGAATPGGNTYGFWKDDPEILAVMDAFRHIGGNPDLIARFIHGTADTTIKIERTIAFSQALIDAGYDSLHNPVDGGSHSDPAVPTTDAGVDALRVLKELIDLSGS